MPIGRFKKLYRKYFRLFFQISNQDNIKKHDIVLLPFSRKLFRQIKGKSRELKCLIFREKLFAPNSLRQIGFSIQTQINTQIQNKSVRFIKIQLTRNLFFLMCQEKF